MSTTRRLMARSVRTLSPAIAGVIFIVLWEVLILIFDVQKFLLPAPSAIAEAFGSKWSTILQVSWVTIQAVLLGMLLGTGGGILVAYLVSTNESDSGPLLVIATALNCAPIIALAPIANNWFGLTSIISKASIAGLMVFFPVLVNCTRGLMLIQPLHRDVMTSYASSDNELVRYVRIPNALPYLFSALRLGASLSVIGVIVAEYFGGPVKALGVFIGYEAALSRFDSAWAGIIVASAMGLSLLGIVGLIERLTMPSARNSS